MGSYQSIYEDDSIQLRRDTTSSLTANDLTATNYVLISAANWTIQIPTSLTSNAGSAGNLYIQANNSNIISRSSTGINWTVNKLLNQPGTKKIANINSSFSANWTTIAILSAGVGISLISINNTPVRYVRLTGAGLSATNFVAFVWTDKMSQGV